MNGTALGRIVSQPSTSREAFVPAKRAPASLSSTLNRLISAAVVSPHFRNLLLSDPVSALAAGYNGEKFALTPHEYAVVTSLSVSTVRDFAAQLLHVLQFDAVAPEASHMAENARSVQGSVPDSAIEQTTMLTRGHTTDNQPRRHQSPALRRAHHAMAASEVYSSDYFRSSRNSQ